MPRKPNYQFERLERDRAKAAKKAEKLRDRERAEQDAAAETALDPDAKQD